LTFYNKNAPPENISPVGLNFRSLPAAIIDPAEAQASPAQGQFRPPPQAYQAAAVPQDSAFQSSGTP